MAEEKRRQRRNNTYRAGVHGGGKQNTGTELICKAAIKGKFPESKEGLNLHSERAVWVLGKTDQQQSSLRYILVMLSDFKGEGKFLRPSKPKKK